MASDHVMIRTAVRADLSALDALYARSYPALLKHDYPPSVLVTALPLISKVQPHLLATGTYFVAIDDGQVVAAGGWTRAAPQAISLKKRARIGHIRHVVTDHRRVRQGIGRALIAHIVETASADGITRLECLSTRTAVPFYAACGFAQIAPVSIGMRPGIEFPAIRMQRDL